MKGIKFAAVVFLFAVSICSAQLTRWGLPTKVYISAYAIDDYSQNGGNNLDRSIYHKDRFIEQIQEKLNASYPNISFFVRHNRENSAATWDNFTNDNTNISEFVFFAGHGKKNGLAFYNGDLHLNIIVNGTIFVGKNFGGNTRWVIFDACSTLSASDGEMFGWFNGVHAILGNRSLSWQYINRYNCFFTCSHYRSEDQYNNFASRFITNGEPIWFAYHRAVGDVIYGKGGYGIETSIVYAYGNADNGQYVNFSEEKFQNVYNGPFHYLKGAKSFATVSASYIYGNPKY